MQAAERQQRQALIDQCLWMNQSGLNQGTAGNLSVRFADVMLITPSGIPYEQLTPEMLPAMPIAGEYGRWQGDYKPSSEWRFHLDILRARPEAGAVVHTHSPFATALAITRRSIPSVHYMIAAFGGNDVRCAEYATFGTEQLSQHALQALAGRKACLLANHGMITVGESLEKAMWLAVELETLCQQYYHTLLLGDAVLLNEQQMAEAHEAFKGYGLKPSAS